MAHVHFNRTKLLHFSTFLLEDTTRFNSQRHRQVQDKSISIDTDINAISRSGRIEEYRISRSGGIPPFLEIVFMSVPILIYLSCT
jgi:hypothetical protein